VKASVNTPLHKLSFFAQLLILLLGAAGSTDAQMASASSEACPNLPQMTYDESGEFPRSGCRSHFLDPLQFIPFSSLGGENELVRRLEK
jgi:hypothetical protein